MVLKISVKVNNLSQTVFKLQIRHEYMTKFPIYNIQRTITPKVGNHSYGSCVLLLILW